MRFLAHFSLLAIFLLFVAASPVETPSKFTGSLAEGVELSVLQFGGAALTVQISNDSFVENPSSASLIDAVSSCFRCDTIAGFQQQVREALLSGFVLISKSKKQLKMKFGPMANISVPHDSMMTFQLSGNLLASGRDGAHLTSTIFLGTQASITLLTSDPMAGKELELRVGRVSPHSIRVVQGSTCRGDTANIVRRRVNGTALYFTPARGGSLSFCVVANGREFQMRGVVLVSGVEGLATTPPHPRSNKDFYVNLFGTGMTEQDSVAFSKTRCELEAGDFELMDFEFSSPSRAGFFVNVPQAGEFHVCYLRYGGEHYIDVGSILVLRGGDAVIDGSSAHVHVEGDTVLLRNSRLGSLIVTSGSLTLDRFNLNVTDFQWYGGAIIGPGVISVNGDSSLIRIEGKLHIDFSLRIMGQMRVSSGGIFLSQMGAILNSQKLVIEVPHTATFSIVGQLSHSTVRNSPAGTIAFHANALQRIELNSTLMNFGTVIVHSGRLICSSFVGHRGSSFTLDASAHFQATRGSLQGSYILGGGATFQLVVPPHESMEVSGALIEMSDNSLFEVVSGTVLLSGSRFNGRGAISFGSEQISHLQMEGTTIFSFGTTVGFQKTKLLSTTGCMLIFFGNVAVNLETTTIGDNVVIQSRLAAIVFAKGSSGTRLIPKAPLNTSLVVPANTTLVVVDTLGASNSSLSSNPVVCSYFVVIPIFVAADGDILLRGCAMLPFGGTLNGVVSGPSFDVLDASIKTAFCKTALLGGEGCVAASAVGSLADTGLLLSGTFRSDPINSLSFQLGYLRLTNGSLGVGGRLSLESPFLEVDSGSSLYLENGGILTVDQFVLRGLLETQADLTIRGDLDARNGILKLPIASGCHFPVSVDGEALYDRAVVQCSSHPPVPQTGALIRSESFVSEPSVDQASCTSSSLVAHVVLDQQSGLRLIVSESSFQTTLAQKMALMGLLLIFIGFLAWALGFSLRELVLLPPLNIDLLWTEFSMFIPNILVSLGLLLEVALLCAPAFLHSVPNTFILGWFSKMASAVVEPRHGTSAFPLAFLCALLIFFWLVAWLPLCRRSLVRFMDDGSSPVFRRTLRLLFQVHTAAAVVIPPFFVPVLSVVLESVVCNSIYADAQSCQHLRFSCWPYVAASIAFAFLVPHCGISASFPFAHPPYQRELDIRFKRSYVITKHCSSAFLVSLWKLAAADRMLLLCASFAVIALQMLVAWRAHPSCYANVNAFVCRSMLFPLWAHTAAIFSEIHSSQSTVCPDTDYAFIAMIVVGWILITIAMVYWVGDDVNSLFGTDHDIGAQLRCIVESCKLIEECRGALYHAGSEVEKGIISQNLSALKLRHLQQLTLFRHMKEVIILPYCLGDKHGQLHYEVANPLPPSGIQSIGSESKSASADGDLPLTVDLMDSYVRGPTLGSGSYGSVYMGMLSITGRLVAVKEVRISSRRKDALSQAKKEVEFLQSLSHPNIIQYFGCRNKGGMMYVFMEFATGGSLTSLVRKFGRLQESVVGLFVHQILTGLSYLHTKGIVHRDVKGDNILIDSCGVAKLADFGCSKLLADIANTGEAGCGTLIGSPYWMAPEVIRSEAYGTKADIWSLGCTVVEMLNGGEPAWREKFETAYAAMYFIGHATEQFPSNIPDGVSDGCKDFLSRCFERDVSRRAAAEELLSHPWLQEAHTSPNGTGTEFSSASVSMDSCTRSDSPTADASYEREMSSFN